MVLVRFIELRHVNCTNESGAKSFNEQTSKKMLLGSGAAVSNMAEQRERKAEQQQSQPASEKPERHTAENRVPEIFPQYQQYTLTQEEYIRALEQSVQLLQREVERLRAQQPPVLSQPVDPLVQEESSLRYTIQLIKFSHSSEEILQQIHRYLSQRFPVFESAMFLFEGENLKPVVALETDSSMHHTVKHFTEEGIIDWVMNNRRTVIIPDIHAQEQQHLHYILVPLYLRGTKLGIFIAQTSATPAELNSEDLKVFTILAESAAVAIDNIRSATEIQKMNQRLRELNRQLLQSAKLASLGELAAAVAHEINNPLQILLGHIQLLENGIGDPKARIQVIKQQIYRIRDITQHLLQLARSIPTEAAPEPAEIVRILRSVLNFLSAQLQRDGIEIVTEFALSQCWVLGHPMQLEQVFMNLILNARDAMPEGGTLTVSVVQWDERTVAILIQDTGVGIPEEQLPKVFDPFFTTKPPGKGTGLGLAIARDIILNHHGKISLHSEVGKGTTVKILLPIFSLTPPMDAKITEGER